ncbi:MAG: exosortase N [Chryseolinea sp.]
MIRLAITRWNKETAIPFIFVLIGLLGGAFAFTPAYFSNTNVLIGLCLLPFSFFITGSKRNNFIYICLLAFFALLALIWGVRIFYFLTLAFYFLWLFEYFAGRLNVLILFLIVFMSPFFIQVITILGFPLRLTLSEYAGALLNIVGTNVQVQGNMMIVNNAMFSVDEACMGLNMLAISMLMGVFVLAYRSKLSGTWLNLYCTSFFFIVVFILNMITNLIRIVVLVYLRIPPENPMHEFVGILCLVVYLVIPLHLISGWLIRKYGKLKHEQELQPRIHRGNRVLLCILPLVVLCVGLSIEGTRKTSNIGHANVQFGSGTPENLDDGITKVSTNELLIYVKTIPEFFTGEHTPLMCWKGSGYEFAGVTTGTVAGVTIYKGILVKDGNTLHTAWWYSNGEIETISQLDWRMRMLKGEARFCLVNVTAKDEHTLMKSIASIFTAHPIIL